MSKVFAAVNPVGEILFESISDREADVRISGSDAHYGGWKVQPLKMFPFKGDVNAVRQSGTDQWSGHSMAWLWKNEDGSYWMDTLSLKEEDATAWSSNRSRSEAMGMKVVPVQFSSKMTAHEIAKNLREQIASSQRRGDVMAETTWACRAQTKRNYDDPQ